MHGYPSVYRFGQNWTADYLGGTRDHPSGPFGRENFPEQAAAIAAAAAFVVAEGAAYHSTLRATYAADREREVHRRAQANLQRRVSALA
jgi:hypothetical protein